MDQSWFSQYHTLSHAAILYSINSASINSPCSARDLERGERTATAAGNCGEHYREARASATISGYREEHPLDNPTPVYRTIFWRLSYMPQQQSTTSRLPACHVSQHSARLYWTLARHRSNRARMIRWERAGFIGHYQQGYKAEARTKTTVCISAIQP